MSDPPVWVWLAGLTVVGVQAGCEDVVTEDSEGAGYWQGSVILSSSEAVHGWTVSIQFDNNVDAIDSALG